MSTELTLTEAAERLAPVFQEEGQSSRSAPAEAPKGKWLSLENAGAVLAERVAGQRRTPKTKKTDVTIDQAARQIEAPYVDLADLRIRREAASGRHLQCLVEQEDFSNRAIKLFWGTDPATLAASPDFEAACAYELQLKGATEAARREEEGAWNRECKAQNDVFEAGRPDWSAADSKRIAEMLFELGVPEQEMWQLWQTPQPINVSSPICMWLAQLVVGLEDPTPIHTALREVGFDASEIDSVMSGHTKIMLRDHRIQELVARAADVYAKAEDQAAA